MADREIREQIKNSAVPMNCELEARLAFALFTCYTYFQEMNLMRMEEIRKQYQEFWEFWGHYT